MPRLDAPELWQREALLGYPETPAPDVGHVLNVEHLAGLRHHTPGPETIWCAHVQNEIIFSREMQIHVAPRTDLSQTPVLLLLLCQQEAARTTVLEAPHQLFQLASFPHFRW